MNAISEDRGRTVEQLDAVLDRLTARVRLQLPEVRCRVHHGANERFAWWVAARLSNAQHESKVVDISIECRADDAAGSIHADLAREDGTVLQELSPAGLTGELAVDVTQRDVTQRVESFLQGNVACIVAELA